MFSAKYLFGFFLFLVLLSSVSAQELAEIEMLQAKIAKLTSKMNDSEKKAALLTRKLALSSAQIDNLNSQLTKIENDIAENTNEIEKHEKTALKLKKYIKSLLIYTYKTRNLRYKTTFLVSSSDFNEAYKRYLYVKFYSEMLEGQIKSLKLQNMELLKQNLSLKKMKDELYQLANKKTEQMLDQKKTAERLNELTRTLKRNKDKVRRELNQKQTMLRKLNTTVNDEIEQYTNTEASSSGFSKMKGKLILPMPGIITEKFGKHRHKILENVTVNSNGIEITGTKNAKVQAVFIGKVTNITEVPGSANAVIIKHGEYYSVYSNISKVKLNVGDKVKAGTLVGYCASSGSDTETSVLFFQIWKKKLKLNPEYWLKK